MTDLLTIEEAVRPWASIDAVVDHGDVGRVYHFSDMHYPSIDGLNLDIDQSAAVQAEQAKSIHTIHGLTGAEHFVFEGAEPSDNLEDLLRSMSEDLPDDEDFLERDTEDIASYLVADRITVPGLTARYCPSIRHHGGDDDDLLDANIELIEKEFELADSPTYDIKEWLSTYISCVRSPVDDIDGARRYLRKQRSAIMMSETISLAQGEPGVFGSYGHGHTPDFHEFAKEGEAYIDGLDGNQFCYDQPSETYDFAVDGLTFVFFTPNSVDDDLDWDEALPD